jgi:hypothetical protein
MYYRHTDRQTDRKTRFEIFVMGRASENSACCGLQTGEEAAAGHEESVS